MKAMKERDKCVKLLQKELERIHTRSTLLNVRRSIRKAGGLLGEVVDFIERYDPDLLSIQALKMKNIYLARALQKERERSSLLLHEKNQLESAFHELRSEKIEIKRDKVNLERMLLSDMEDFKNTLPHIVELSDLYSRKMLKYNAIKKNITGERFSNTSFGHNTSTPPVSTVSPMIKGCVIQKPTINVRRVPLPNETRSSMFEYVNINSPIPEDGEETVSPANNPTRRCENGLRNVLNTSSRRRAERRLSPASTAETSNNTADDEQTDLHLEPLVRLEDVTRLLQHSSIRISETPAASPASQPRVEGFMPEVLIPKLSLRANLDLSDNPLEGCSWMYRRSSPSEEEEEKDKRKSTFPSFQNKSSKSPLFPRSPFCTKRKSSDANPTQRSASTPIPKSKLPSSNNDEDVVVSSSNVDVDEEPLPVGITRRKRKHSVSSRSRSRSSETNENHVPNDVELAPTKRSHHLRRSTRLFDRIGDFPDGTTEKNKKSTSRLSRVADSNEVLGTNSATPNDSEIADSNDTTQPRKVKKPRKTSKANVSSVSNVSNSDPDDSLLQSRPRRNRGTINFKEPSLHTKLRRN